MTLLSPPQRIGTTILAKMVATARTKANELIYQSLQDLLTQVRTTWLDDLLEVEPNERGKIKIPILCLVSIVVYWPKLVI